MKNRNIICCESEYDHEVQPIGVYDVQDVCETEEILGYDCDGNKINDYYLNMSGGSPRLVNQFYEVKTNLSFKQFNIFINSLDENRHTTVSDIYSKMSKK